MTLREVCDIGAKAAAIVCGALILVVLGSILLGVPPRFLTVYIHEAIAVGLIGFGLYLLS